MKFCSLLPIPRVCHAGQQVTAIAQMWKQDTVVYSNTARQLELGENQDSCACILVHFISKAQIVHTKPAQLYLQRHHKKQKQALSSHTSNVQDTPIVKSLFPDLSNQH